MSDQYEMTIRMLEQERDRYKLECELLKSSRLNAASPSRRHATKEQVVMTNDKTMLHE